MIDKYNILVIKNALSKLIEYYEKVVNTDNEDSMALEREDSINYDLIEKLKEMKKEIEFIENAGISTNSLRVQEEDINCIPHIASQYEIKDINEMIKETINNNPGILLVRGGEGAAQWIDNYKFGGD